MTNYTRYKQLPITNEPIYSIAYSYYYSFMHLSVFQLNAWNGHFLPDIIKYIQKYSFDIVQLQEISGGTLSEVNHQCFSELSDALDGYYGLRVSNIEDANNPANYRGNAVFYKREFTLRDYAVTWLKPQIIARDLSFLTPETEPRSVQILTLKDSSGIVFHCLNTHLAWGSTPEDAPYKTEQAWKLDRIIDELSHPYILTGDFNVVDTTSIVSRFSENGQNLVSKYHITNTLNPRVHRVKHLFPPGLAVDYIIASRHFTVDEFHLVDEVDLSDHFGLRAVLRLDR